MADGPAPKGDDGGISQSGKGTEEQQQQHHHHNQRASEHDKVGGRV